MKRAVLLIRQDRGRGSLRVSANGSQVLAQPSQCGAARPSMAVRAGAAEVAVVHRAHQSQSRRRPPSRAVMPAQFAGGLTRARLPSSGRPGQSSRRDGVGAVGAITRAPQRSHVQTVKRNPRTHRCGGITRPCRRSESGSTARTSLRSSRLHPEKANALKGKPREAKQIAALCQKQIDTYAHLTKICPPFPERRPL